MIIDCHTHIGRNKHISADVGQLLTSMNEAHIDKSIVFAGDINDISNEYLLEQIAPHTDKLYGVAAFRYNCLQKEVDQLARWYEEKKIVAVKFYTGYDHFFPADVRWELSLLQEVGCPAIFHCGDCLNSVKCAKLKYAHPLHIDDVANDFPKMNFIIAHMGFPWVVDTAEVCYKNENVYADISGFVYGKFTGQDKSKFKKTMDQFLDITSSEKLLFGTDWPISNQSSYNDALEWISTNIINRKVSESFTPQYLSQNVQKVFKL